MSYFRSYFEKNNTIIKNSQVNTSKNPTTEIFYGTGFSKFLFKIDLNDLKTKIDNGDLVLDNNTSHYLKMTNTIFGDEGLRGQNRSTGRNRATSFDLILFQIPEFWDEGVGFDYEQQSYDFTAGNNTFDERPSNWFNRTTLDQWSSQGVYATTPTIISGSTHTNGLIHFDNGNENLNVDITEYVNGVLTGGTINHGLGLAFAVIYQDITPEVDQSIAFFTKYTQTFYEPFVESHFEDNIVDNRNNFIEKQDQNLYLYVTKGSNFYDLDELPTVDITDTSGNVITGLGNLTTTKIKKGVYKVTFAIDGVVCDGKRFYLDVWKDLSLDGVSISNVTQKFIPKPYTSLFTVGQNQVDSNRYSVQFYGVKEHEKIVRGENRKITVSFRSIDTPKGVLFDEVFYRLYIKEGKTQVTIFDWTQLDVTNENSFMLDTKFMIPREYTLEIKGKKHNEEIFYKDPINFEIVSEK
jgi:hypothetical protein